jgi:hypothetical protein
MAKPFWPDEIELPAVRYSDELVARRAAQKLMSSVSTAKITKKTMVENSAWRIWDSGCAEYADPQRPKVDAVARRSSMQFREKRIFFQSSCRTNTNKPVKTTLKTMQLANAIIAGLKSAATTAIGVRCRALWIKKAIIAKYETIITSASRNRRAPNLLAVTRNGPTSVALCKLAP